MKVGKDGGDCLRHRLLALTPGPSGQRRRLLSEAQGAPSSAPPVARVETQATAGLPVSSSTPTFVFGRPSEESGQCLRLPAHPFFPCRSVQPPSSGQVNPLQLPVLSACSGPGVLTQRGSRRPWCSLRPSHGDRRGCAFPLTCSLTLHFTHAHNVSDQLKCRNRYVNLVFY